jgi:hypothetical protein
MNKSDFRVGMRIIDASGRTGKVVNVREHRIVYNLDNGGMETALFSEVSQPAPTGKKLSEIRTSINNTASTVEDMRPETKQLIEGIAKEKGIPLNELNRAWVKGMASWKRQTLTPQQWATKQIHAFCEDWEMQRRAAVQKEIDRDPRIGKKEAQKIHALLRTVKPQGTEQGRVDAAKEKEAAARFKRTRYVEEEGGVGSPGSDGSQNTVAYTDGLGYKNGPNDDKLREDKDVNRMFESLLLGTDHARETYQAMTPGEKGYNPNVHLTRDRKFGHTDYKLVQGRTKAGGRTSTRSEEARAAEASKTTKAAEAKDSKKKKVKAEDTNPGIGADSYNSNLYGNSLASPGGGMYNVTNESTFPKDQSIRKWAMRSDIQESFTNRYGKDAFAKLLEAAKRMYDHLNKNGRPKGSFSQISKKLRKEDALGTASSGSDSEGTSVLSGSSNQERK